jgi:hypothetical protein
VKEKGFLKFRKEERLGSTLELVEFLGGDGMARRL